MAKNPAISNAAAIAMCDALVDLLDVGGGTAVLEIYDGSQPANPDVAVTSQNLLASLDLSNPAFGGAADAAPGAIATANSISDDTSANATGTATWFRAKDRAGTAVIDGSVGTSNADLVLDDVAIVSGQTVKVNSWTITQPES